MVQPPLLFNHSFEVGTTVDPKTPRTNSSAAKAHSSMSSTWMEEIPTGDGSQFWSEVVERMLTRSCSLVGAPQFLAHQQGLEPLELVVTKR